MERLVVSGVTHNLNEAKIRVKGVQDHPGIAGKLFAPLSDAGIVIDMIVQTANGRLTAAEALGHREFVMTKLYRSA